MLDSVNEAHDPNKTALIWDVDDKSRAEASGDQGSSEESVLLDTAAVGVMAPAEGLGPVVNS